jgi:ATP-dependent DNA ligase
MIVAPPIEPMLAKIADEIPEGAFLYEPKWDGFRAIVFRDDDIYIQSRDLRPFDRYFPDLHEALRPQLPEDCVIDGEIVIANGGRSRFRCTAAETASSGFARREARARNACILRRLRRACRERPRSSPRDTGGAAARARATPRRRQAAALCHAVTRERKLAQQWLQRFEGAGLDGSIAKPLDLAYQPASARCSR